MSGIAPKQNSFKFKIAPHKQKSIVKNIFGRKMGLPANNCKSGTGTKLAFMENLNTGSTSVLKEHVYKSLVRPSLEFGCCLRTS